MPDERWMEETAGHRYRWTQDELEFGEWLRAHIEETAPREMHGWAPERAERVVAVLEADRPAPHRVVPIVLWMREVNAFTAAGRYVYLSRRLVERCPDDETAAFIMAHEIAHHDLGHLRVMPDWLPEALEDRGGLVVAAIYTQLAHFLYSPEKEADADRRALEMCVAAGYDGRRCLNALTVLERHALDVGAHDVVFGPDTGDDTESDSWLTRARKWIWQRAIGYPSLHERRSLLQEHLATLPSPRSAASRALATTPSLTLRSAELTPTPPLTHDVPPGTPDGRWYAAVLILQTVVRAAEASSTFTDHEVRLLRAASADEAHLRAVVMGEAETRVHRAADGSEVEWTFLGVGELEALEVETFVDGAELISWRIPGNGTVAPARDALSAFLDADPHAHPPLPA